MNKLNGFYNEEQLKEIGLKSFGKNVLISEKASLYDAKNIEIGDNVRIDDFCLLVGNVTIGSYVHIAPYASIHGSGGGQVILKDFTALASGSAIYAASDDFNGGNLTNSMIPVEFLKIKKSNIVMEKHSIVGMHSVLLPGAYLAEGTVLGTMSLLSKKTKEWNIYFGIPAKRVNERNRGVLEQEHILMSQIKENENG